MVAYSTYCRYSWFWVTLKEYQIKMLIYHLIHCYIHNLPCSLSLSFSLSLSLYIYIYIYKIIVHFDNTTFWICVHWFFKEHVSFFYIVMLVYTHVKPSQNSSYKVIVSMIIRLKHFQLIHKSFSRKYCWSF